NQPQALGGFDTNWGRNDFPAFAEHFWNTGSETVYFSSFEKDQDNNGVPDGWCYAGPRQNARENLIQNSSFENGLSNWEIYTGEVGIDSKVYHAGHKSVHFHSMSSKDSSISGNFIPIEPDTDYVLSAWAKANNIVIGTTGWHKLFIVARFYDCNKMQLKDIYPDLGMDAGTYDWTLFKTIHHSPNNAVYFRIFRLGLIDTGIGEGWIDDISFSKYEPPVYSVEGRDMQGAPGFSRCAVSVKGVSNIIHSDFIRVESNRKYLLSAYIKRHKVDGKENPCFKIIWHNSDQRYLSETTKVVENVSAEYKYFEIGTVSPQNAFYAKIYLQGQEGGDEYFWFDTVSLRVSRELEEFNVVQNNILPPKNLQIEQN
ncbi:MAG: carbohydrate binding domain-containing protein, partial [Candidatus Methanoperedenaceae archaeon]|nr:carbohydrate binding domain-containing protein [Candidatus Methanoperedenaceae archaeon]